MNTGMDKVHFLKKTITLLLFFQFFVSCNFFSQDEKIQCNNLFLVYMAGDNSLNKTVYSDFEELKEGIKTENDIILVLADRYTSNFYEDEWNEARLFQISFEDKTVKVLELEDEKLGISIEWLDDNIDSGSESTLRNFLQYAAKRYDCKKLYLDLWNHGGGWKSGDSYPGIQAVGARNICFDEESTHSLSLKEMSSSIKNSKIPHFDILLMDACSMASVEVAAELSGLTDTVIFSQDIIPEDGMPYEKIVPLLFSDISTDEKCIQICDSYTQSYEKHKTTISAFRIDEDNSIKIFLENFESRISSFSDFEKISQELSYYYNFLSDVIDIEIFFDDELKNEYNKILIKNCSDYSSGLSIYCPEFISYSKDSWEYTSERLNFLECCPSYLEFLKTIEKTNSSCTAIDTFEPNNYQLDSYEVNAEDGNILSYLWNSSDEDWYVFRKGETISKIKLEEPGSLDYNLLVLLYKNGKLIKSLNENEQNETEIPDYAFDVLYVKVYSTFGYYSQDDSYSLRW